MPVYEYRHVEEYCEKMGRRFEFSQSMNDKSLTQCPECGRPVKKIISLCSVNTPKTDSDYKSLGFTKLVRRDEGVYENVTALDGESRYMEAGKPETIPDIKRRISD